MDDLIAKLEKATGPDRELDCEIAIELGRLSPNWRHSWKKEDIIEAAYNWNVKYYTQSIDAALTLVPEGAEWLVGSIKLLRTFWAEVVADKTYIGKGAPTPAIALCIAALKARAALHQPSRLFGRDRFQ